MTDPEPSNPKVALQLATNRVDSAAAGLQAVVETYLFALRNRQDPEYGGSAPALAHRVREVLDEVSTLEQAEHRIKIDYLLGDPR